MRYMSNYISTKEEEEEEAQRRRLRSNKEQ